MNRRFLFLVASGRREGNTELLARRAAAALPSDVEQEWIHLDEAPLPRFEDIRHHAEKNTPWPEPEGNEKLLLEATLKATDIVFVTPVYWYSLPSSAKLYIDHWSDWMRVPGAHFSRRMGGKHMWVVSVLADEPAQATLLLQTLKQSAQYLGMHWGGELIGNGSKPGDVLKDERALEAAEHFFDGVAGPLRASR